MHRNLLLSVHWQLRQGQETLPVSGAAFHSILALEIDEILSDRTAIYCVRLKNGNLSYVHSSDSDYPVFFRVSKTADGGESEQEVMTRRR